MKLKIRKILEVSIIKTLYLNIKYFGLKGLIFPYILVSRHTKIVCAKGIINVKNVGKFDIRIGFSGLDIFYKTNSIFSNSGLIEFNGYCHLGSGTKISNTGKLVFGNNFNITANSSIVCHDNIEFGEDVLCSWNCMIIDTDFHYIDNNVNCKPIFVGDNVWICQNVTLLKGANIPSGCVCAANSMVNKEIQNSNSLIVCDSKVNRKNILWRR